MKSFKIILSFIACVFFTNSHADTNIQSELQKLSYSIGVFFGQNIAKQNINIDAPSFLQAVEDVLEKNKLKLESSEIQQILLAYQQKEQEKLLSIASKNKEKGMDFLTKNKSKEKIIQTKSGLQYKIIREGKGDTPSSDSMVVVDYKGTLIDGTEFDSSYKRGEPVELGVGRVIKGWQEALQMMKVGAKWQLFVPAKLAYGENGVPGTVIGPNETLLFDIELIDIK